VRVDVRWLEQAILVAVVPGPADVVHDLGLAAIDDRRADLRREHVEHFVPRGVLEPSGSARTDALQRMEDASGILDLVEGRRTLRAVLAARAGMVRVALELADRARFLVDVRDETARRLAVETRRRHEHVVPLDLARPLLGFVLDPVVPLLHGRERFERSDLPEVGIVGARHLRGRLTDGLILPLVLRPYLLPGR
jgi:hypothetical protein